MPKATSDCLAQSQRLPSWKNADRLAVVVDQSSTEENFVINATQIHVEKK